MKKKPEIPAELATFIARESLSKVKKPECHKCGAKLEVPAGSCYICLVCGESGGCEGFDRFSKELLNLVSKEYQIPLNILQTGSVNRPSLYFASLYDYLNSFIKAQNVCFGI